MKVCEAFQQWQWACGVPTQGDVITFDGGFKYFLTITGHPPMATLQVIGHRGTKCGQKAWDGTAPQGVVAFGEEGSTARYAEGFPHMGIKQGKAVFERGSPTVLRRGLVVRQVGGMVHRIVQWRDGKSFFLQIVSGGGLPPGILLDQVKEEGPRNEEGILTKEVCRKLGIWTAEIVSFGE